MNKLILACGLTAISLGAANGSLAEKRPNVLMITIDDLANYPLDASRFNQVKTPNLDRLVESSLSFRKAYCAAPLCNPSRSAIISGISPHRSGAVKNSARWEATPLLKASVCMPELFKKNGYATMWSGKFWHGTSTPCDESLAIWWDEYTRHGNREGFGPESQEHVAELEGTGITSLLMASRFGMLDVPDNQWQDTRVANQTVERFRRDFDRPFFIVAGLVRPHSPFTAPKRFFELYDRDQIELPPWQADDWKDIPGAADAMILHQYDWDRFVESGLWKDVIHAYIASVSFMDWNLGRILDALEQSEYADNTIVMLWSDHGFHLGEKSHFAKSALWEQTTHVPFIVRLPEMKSGAQCQEVVSLLDVYPTIVDLCHLQGVPEGQLDGTTLVPLITEGKWAAQTALTSYETGNYSLRNDRYRYIRYDDGSEELYDHKLDPNEWTNRASHPEYAAIKTVLINDLNQKVRNALPPQKQRK